METKRSNWKASDLQLGDWADCTDTVNKWCVARVVDKDEDSVTVSYEGWADKWNEKIPINSRRLAPFRSNTKGDTGYKKRLAGGDFNGSI